MSTVILKYHDFAQRFGCDVQIIKSWWQHKGFNSDREAQDFFEENREIIHAKPFVKWVGGKRQLISQLKDLFPEEYNNYYEPFLGGGAVFFNLQKKQSFLSDLNEELINTYLVIKKYPKKLISFLEKCKYSRDFYATIRSWDREVNWQKKYTDIERAGRFIFLNRTCFNGLHRVNSRGEFNVPMGKYVNPDFVQKNNILNVSNLLNQTEAVIKFQSFEKVLETAKNGDFIYFDPPYDILTETANFTSYNKDSFGRDMQVMLAGVYKKLNEKGCKIMLSNHNTPLIRELYKGFDIKTVTARRNVNSRSSGRGTVEEVVVINYKIHEKL